MIIIHLIFDIYLIYLLTKSDSAVRKSAKHFKKERQNYFACSNESYDSGYMDGEWDGAVDQEILDKRIYENSYYYDNEDFFK